MKRVIRKPYLFFWILAPIVLLTGVFLGDNSLDINIHDTYIIFPQLHLSIFVSFMLFLTGLLYFFIERFDRKLIKALTIFHLSITLLSIIVLYFYISKDLNYEQNLPKRYYESKQPMYDDLETKNMAITLSILLFLIGQFAVFPINIIISLFRKKN